MATLVLPRSRAKVLAVGLDVDGVLRDTAYRAYLALCMTVEELGGTPPLFEAFVQNYESDWRSYYRDCGVQDLERVYPVYLRHVGTPDDIAPFSDVKDFLQHLRELNLKMFAVSSHPTEMLKGWFATHGIDDHLLCIYGGSRDKRVCIQNACKSIGVDPSVACYVGDWGLDMRAAKAVGLLPIGITRGYASRGGLAASGAAHVVDHLCELAGLLY